MSYSKEERIQIFVEAIALHGETQTDAYLKAYPHAEKWKRKTCGERASKLANTDKVQTMLQKRQ